MKHKVLEENVLVQVDNIIIKATAVLSAVSGGKAINYLDYEGRIIKSEAYSSSPYYLKNSKDN